MATAATITEGFKLKYQGNINTPVVEISFSPGEQVQVLKDWKNETCLIKKGTQVFNVPKKYLSPG